MRVLLADDQSKVRSALRLVLEQQPGIHVLGEAVDITGLLDWVRVTWPDLVLLDWELPGLEADGLPTLRELCPCLAQRLVEERIKDRLREAEQHRLIRAAQGSQKARGWWSPLTLMLGSLVGLVVRPQS